MPLPLNKTLILGGTGFVGRTLCEQLVRRSGGADERIRVPTRRPQHGNSIRSLPTVEIVEADVHDDAQLARLVGGCDAVVNLVGILHGSRAAFDRAHTELPRRLAAACQAAGVQRVIHVSALGVGPDASSNYLRSKTAGETALKQSGLALTLLRPSVMFGADDRFLNLFAQMQALAPVVPLACGQARMQPVWVDDVARMIVHCIEQPATIGATYECAGPTQYTLSELVALAGRWSGHERPQIALPGPIGRLQALLLEWLPGEPLLSRDNLDSLATPNVASGMLPGMIDLGLRPTPLEAVAPGYLGQMHGRARLERWRGSARRL